MDFLWGPDGVKPFSSGEMRKLLIGQALASDPRLLILDEPCNGLDADHRQRLLMLLDRGQPGHQLALCQPPA